MLGVLFTPSDELPELASQYEGLLASKMGHIEKHPHIYIRYISIYGIYSIILYSLMMFNLWNVYTNIMFSRQCGCHNAYTSCAHTYEQY